MQRAAFNSGTANFCAMQFRGPALNDACFDNFQVEICQDRILQDQGKYRDFDVPHRCTSPHACPWEVDLDL